MDKNSILKKIVLDRFSNKEILEMGLLVIEMAKKIGKPVAVEISRLNHVVFFYIDDELPADKLNWIRRKRKTAIHFEESTLSIKHDLEEKGMSLKKTFGLSSKNYLAKGGAIPLFLAQGGMIGVITVSGLSDVEDHQLIVNALEHKMTFSIPS